MFRASLALFLILMANPVAAKRLDPAAICAAAARQAARETGVPENVLLALTLTETGRRSKDRGLEPWAWALNRGGESLWFDNQEQALNYLDQALAAGTRNIDLGCFQINWGWHGHAFPSVRAMMDPATNARYAANMMARLYQDTGDWISAAAAYHSATPEYASRYRARFEPIYASVSGGTQSEAPLLASAAVRTRQNDFPLLRGGESASIGSLVPQTQRGIPLFGGS